MHDIRNNESDIISQILSGNRDAFRVIVDTYSGLVFSAVRRFVKDDDTAAELAQQVFVKCYDKLETFKSESSFSSWLYSLAMNHCRDYIKNIRRSNERLDDAVLKNADLDISEDQNPEQVHQQNELLELMHDSIHDLAPEYSEPLMMKYIQGMPYEIISERLNVSVSALKVRLHRAKLQLKQMIEEKL